MESFSLSAFAQLAAPAPLPRAVAAEDELKITPIETPPAQDELKITPIETTPPANSAPAAAAPLNTHLFETDANHAPILENKTADEDSFENSSFADPAKRRGKYQLYDPNKYEFMQEPKMMFPPSDNTDEEVYDDSLRYSRAYLAQAMKDIEGGVELQEQGVEYLEILNPSLMLPIFGTSISLTGRKTFGFTYLSKKYKVNNPLNNRDESGVTLEQELQMKVQGKISERIFVDIDYDDQREDAQNISVSYRGKGEEFVQSADFGDIELSLPGTEFLSYNKQVFGAKMHLKYGNANLRLIGSQNKGETRSKQFKGDSVFETVNLKDTQYIRRRYYDLTFQDTTWGQYSIVSGSETVYLDDHTNQGYQETGIIAEDYKVPASTYPSSGNAAFKVLTRGVDYSIDYVRNILIFNRTLADSDVVVVDYQNSNGQWLRDVNGNGRPKIVKTVSDRPISSAAEIGYQLEKKVYYDIGSKQITRDNGQGNFILKLLEPDGKEVCQAGDTRAYCKNNMDFDKGIFELSGRFDDQGIYNTTPVSSSNRYFFIQFTSTVKTYFLEPDIVVQSETVKVNGATMARNKDYYVDYASGFITFYNENLIGSNSVIDVSYEVASAGGDTALLGGRFNYDFTKNITIGASILNEGGSKPKQVPQVGNLATNLTVMEADFKMKDVEVADGVKITLGAEAAQSRKDENLFGYALVDNMEETKEYIKATMNYKDWRFGSNPNGKTSFYDAIRWDSQDVNILEINPSAAASANDKQSVLIIDYDFEKGLNHDGRDEVSLVFPISSFGVDFTTKTLLELALGGELNGPDINISFGTVDEISDDYSHNGITPYVPPGFSESQIIPTCSKYYTSNMATVPKTEDLRCTGQLTAQEDIGWLFINPDGSYARYNPFINNQYNKESQPNGFIDTQDLNGNGILDSQDITSGGSFGYDGDDIDPINLPNNNINFTGWKQFQKEVDFNDGTNRWTAIRQMRITLKKTATSKTKGTIKIANLAVSGSTWQALDDSEKTPTPYGINNIDNHAYKPIFNDNGDGGEVFRTLYGSVNNLRQGSNNNVKEQSLALQYDFSKTLKTDINVQRNFSAMDFSQHKEFRFLLYNNGPADSDVSFYMRFFTDDSNYSEVIVPLTFSNAWHTYRLKLIDLNGDGIPDRFEDISGYDSSADNLGALNFKRISNIKVGLRSNTEASGEVWVDDMFLADSVMTVGAAYMGEAKIDVKDWFEVGGKYRYMDDNFQTPVAVPTKQKNTQQDYFLNIKKFQNLPVNATYHHSNIITPDVLNNNTNSNTISMLDQGEVTRDRGAVKAQYIKPSLPKIGVEYIFENADYDKLERQDEKQNYAANLNYTPNNQKSIIRNITAGASLLKSNIDYSDASTISSQGTNYDTKETTQSYNLRLSLQPWAGTSIVPNYTLSVADEKRRYYDANASDFRSKNYSKYASQTAGISTAMRITKWLAPTASYNVNIKENNNLAESYYKVNNYTYNFDVGQVKNINRTSDANIGLSLNGKEILPNTKLFAALTLSGSYRLQDGDSWVNVDDDFNSLDKLWLRSSMGINSPYSYRNNMTLRDTYTATARWVPFREYGLEGRLAPIKTMSLINNFTQAYQTTENYGSAYKTNSSTLPDMVFVMSDMERFFTSSSNILSGTNIKLKYSLIKSNVIGSEYREDEAYGGDLRFLLLNYFDTTLTYNEQTLDKDDMKQFGRPLENYLRRDFSAQTSFNYKAFRFTPKVNYIFDTRSQVGDVLVSEVKEVAPSINIRADFNMPFGLTLPFINRQYLVSNRVVWNTNISYSRRRSFTVSENRDLLDINTNFDYELSKNIRITLSGVIQNFKHLYIEEESYTAYNIGTLLTIQF
ncbi:MAG: hypothetical protein LBM71_05170 [Elusimicrobiota bacterium]|jgi:hypothetical protein|nr:hypothetical protein [Elusimicrobiota bacterium]